MRKVINGGFIILLTLLGLFMGCQGGAIDPPVASTIAEPVFSPTEGNFTGSLEISISTTTADASIYYSTTGTIDTTNYADATEYTAAFSISETTTIHAIAILGAETSTVVSKTYTLGNSPPVVSAGTDITNVSIGDQIQLDGTATDSDGDALTISWIIASKPAGSTITETAFSDTEILNPVFTADAEGDFTLTMAASDGTSAISDSLIISVGRLNTAPVAALAASTYLVTALDTAVIFAGAGGDADAGEILTYSWEITSQPTGSSVSAPTDTLTYSSNDPSSKSITLTHEGEYIVAFTATDSFGESDTDVKTVTVDIPNANGNSQPVANAGIDETVNPVGWSNYALDGTTSADPDGDALTYTWSLTDWPTAASSTIISFMDNGDGTASFSLESPPGAYTFELLVNDGKGYDGTDGTNESSTDTDSVTITITNMEPNTLSISATPGTVYIEDVSHDIAIAAEYTDPNGAEGHIVSIEYYSSPSGSSQPAITASSSSPEVCMFEFTFTPDVVGEYELLLKIIDDTYTVESPIITVTAYDDTQGGINVTIQ